MTHVVSGSAYYVEVTGTARVEASTSKRLRGICVEAGRKTATIAVSRTPLGIETSGSTRSGAELCFVRIPRSSLLEEKPDTWGRVASMTPWLEPNEVIGLFNDTCNLAPHVRFIIGTGRCRECVRSAAEGSGIERASDTRGFVQIICRSLRQECTRQGVHRGGRCSGRGRFRCWMKGSEPRSKFRKPFSGCPAKETEAEK